MPWDKSKKNGAIIKVTPKTLNPRKSDEEDFRCSQYMTYIVWCNSLDFDTYYRYNKISSYSFNSIWLTGKRQKPKPFHQSFLI